MEAKVYVIRHAQSVYNRVLEAWLNEGKLECDLKVNPTLTDPGITDIGVEQVNLAKSLVHALPIDKVYASPLRRSLQTAKGMFEAHPKQPRVFVVPEFTEQLFSSCDLSKSFTGIDPQFPEFDWSALRADSDYWVFDVIDNETTREIKRNFPREQWNDVACTYLGGDGLESQADLEVRCSKVKALLRADLEQGLTVAFVSHWCFIKQLTMQPHYKFVDLVNAQVQDITALILP
eukprot:CAMPEP_0204901506 /NCGR_PEP_ID=MMETSP1397-20131031/3122_1 /ASSEMBLY_ACC=CAM_ASM_000891 /TAXON_ID=49980 /ORGANISM="Climacostomum Climacostomum virens, Strain Stock W-24" /LENGTH=232 /DNA_ID=CAMNT_0052069873 /DNA_START=175 /DNA_END=873 /DNA_ORIENTATION=-